MREPHKYGGEAIARASFFEEDVLVGVGDSSCTMSVVSFGKNWTCKNPEENPKDRCVSDPKGEYTTRQQCYEACTPTHAEKVGGPGGQLAGSQPLALSAISHEEEELKELEALEAKYPPFDIDVEIGHLDALLKTSTRDKTLITSLKQRKQALLAQKARFENRTLEYVDKTPDQVAKLWDAFRKRHAETERAYATCHAVANACTFNENAATAKEVAANGAVFDYDLARLRETEAVENLLVTHKLCFPTGNPKTTPLGKLSGRPSYPGYNTCESKDLLTHYAKLKPDWPNQNVQQMKAELAALGKKEESIVKLEKENEGKEEWRPAFTKALAEAGSITYQANKAVKSLFRKSAPAPK